MPTLEQRIQFATEYIVTREGASFTFDGFEWQRDAFWLPADGWKIWCKDSRDICSGCGDRIGQIHEWSLELQDSLQCRRCAGLELKPIIITVIDVPRQEGKTVATSAYNLATICKSVRQFITLVAGSEGQTDMIVAENYLAMIAQNEKLSGVIKHIGNKLIVDSTGSYLEYVPTSHKSITGRGRTHVVIDEARDIHERVVMALIPSLFAQCGVRCPKGHKTFRKEKNFNPPTFCDWPGCGAYLEPWQGRGIITSSAGIIDGNGRACSWFVELCDQLEEHEHPNFHLYRSVNATNPKRSDEIRGAIAEVFGQLQSTKAYVDVEVFNQPRRTGDDFVSLSDVRGCIDRDLTNARGTLESCVAFLDTSLTRDLTSLVIVANRPIREHERRALWEHVDVIRVDVWDPRQFPEGVINQATIQAHLDEIMPLFPNLTECLVDTRGSMAWAVELVLFCRRDRRAWGHKLSTYNGSTKERNAGWSILEQRILSRTIRLPSLNLIVDELMGMRRISKSDGSYEVRDRNSKVRHADVVSGIAECCRLVHNHQTQNNVTMREIEAGSIDGLLKRLYRPIAGGIDPTSF